MNFLAYEQKILIVTRFDQKLVFFQKRNSQKRFFSIKTLNDFQIFWHSLKNGRFDLTFEISSLPLIGQSWTQQKLLLINVEIHPLDVSGRGQGLVHEPPLGEAGPPLGRLPVLAAVEHAVAESVPGLVAQLQEVLAKDVGLFRGPRPGVDAVEWETGLPGKIEPGDGQRVHLALALGLGSALLELLEAVL